MKISDNRSNDKSESPLTFRIGKFLAHAGVCTRRGAAEFLATNEIWFNNLKISDLNLKIPAEATLIINGRTVSLASTEIVLLNKPAGFVCTHKEQKNQKSIFRLLPESMKHYFFAGRLDEESRGLMVLSNNGSFIYNLSHPSMEVQKIYEVSISRPLSPQEIEKIKRGIWSKGEKLRVDNIVELANKTTYELTLHEGKNREIRRIFESLGIQVHDLYRIRLGDYWIDSINEGSYVCLSA